ncbi:hypothetical protein SAMN04487957_110124 [Halomonas shengliensis]|uniref:Lipoprotein n=1 Tax=Halomonas shengliensis TaxID=419597 RepID=A0A1H0LVS6_9GAMM|nr:hypothetical protein [Halomonas shengliensis]SDO72225.1 hypothetical protein SAMN04487957_110124 [Halomonas shengliensis]
MKRIIFALLAALAAAGCASIDSPMDDGYQFGDLTGTVLSLQAEYCATADPRERAFRLAALRAAGVPIPRSGACADILALMPEVELDIDTAETEADRRRFEEMRHAGGDPAPAADDPRAE